MILSMGGCSYGHLVKKIQLTGEFSSGQSLVNVCLLLKPCRKQSQFKGQLLLNPVYKIAWYFGELMSLPHLLVCGSHHNNCHCH